MYCTSTVTPSCAASNSATASSTTFSLGSWSTSEKSQTRRVPSISSAPAPDPPVWAGAQAASSAASPARAQARTGRERAGREEERPEGPPSGAVVGDRIGSRSEERRVGNRGNTRDVGNDVAREKRELYGV